MEDYGSGYEMPQPQEATKATTAFLVVCYSDGRKAAISDVNTLLELEREATLNDMYDGAGQVMRDIEIMMTTNHVVQNMVNAQMQIAAQAKQMAENEAVVQKLSLPNRQMRRHGM